MNILQSDSAPISSFNFRDILCSARPFVPPPRKIFLTCKSETFTIDGCLRASTREKVLVFRHAKLLRGEHDTARHVRSTYVAFLSLYNSFTSFTNHRHCLLRLIGAVHYPSGLVTTIKFCVCVCVFSFRIHSGVCPLFPGALHLSAQ